jgi:CheY-like chemotaxis protein
MPHKLLLADDSVTIQRVIELTFADEDVKVAVVGDGRQAIERIASDRPDIVLADIGMPERDGYDVAAFVKNDPRYSNIPVILLTGAFEPLDEDRARQVGCDGVLVKPFEPQVVINRVRELLSGRRPIARATGPLAAYEHETSFDSLDAALPPPDPAPQATKGSDALEDYFDRLDAAFANIGTPAAGRSGSPPELARSAPVVHQPAPEPPAVPGSDPMDSWDPEMTAGFGPARQPHLASAFAALLAAEEGNTAATLDALGVPALSEHVIDDIVQRVIARMSDDAVRQSVLEVAERLVRQEIDRIKFEARGSSTPHAGR